MVSFVNLILFPYFAKRNRRKCIKFPVPVSHKWEVTPVFGNYFEYTIYPLSSMMLL